MAALAVSTASVAPTSVDVLAQLQGSSFRGIGFPSLSFSAKYSHRLVRHARMDRDGERVENTGLSGGIHTFKIPCINTIEPGPNETWSQTPGLYPFTYRKLLTALSDRTSGPYINPDLGSRNCKVSDFESTLDPDFRGGPTLVVTLVESTDDDANAVPLASTSTKSLALTAAAALDAAFLTLNPPVDTGTPGGAPLGDWLSTILLALDVFELGVMQWDASISRVLFSLSALQDAFLSMPFDLLTLQFGLLGSGSLFDNVDRLISALHALRAQALSTGANTSLYIVPRDCTVAQIAGRVGNTMEQLFQLNPALAKSFVVPSTTEVRYYA